MDRVIEDDRDLTRLIDHLRHQPRPFTVKVTDGRMRSVEQNALQWLWAGEAAEQRQDVTPADVQCEWKLLYGIPILIADDEKMAATWAKAEARLPYEEQLELMRYMSVTSAMTVRQLKTYLDRIFQWSIEAGVKLTDPEENRSGTTRLPQVGSFHD